MNTSCALSITVGRCAIFRNFLASCINIEIKSRKAVNTDSLFSMALTIHVHGLTNRWFSSWTYGRICLSGIRSWLLRTWTVDWFVWLVTISGLAVNTVALITPFGAMFYNFDTNVFPLGASFITLKTSSCSFIKILAV